MASDLCFVTDAAQSTADALFGPEPRAVREWVVRADAEYRAAEDEGRPLAAAWAQAKFEAHMLVAAVLVGPYLVWRASITLARDTAFPPDEKDGEKRDEAERSKKYQMGARACLLLA